MKNAKRKYGHLQSNTVRSLRSADRACLHTAGATEHHFPPPFRLSLSIRDIGSFIQKVQERKLAFEKIITPVNQFGHVGLLAGKGQATLSIDSKLLGLLIALSTVIVPSNKN